MRISSFNVMRLSLLAGLLLAIESSAAASGSDLMNTEASKLQAAPQASTTNQQATSKPQLANETMDLKRLTAVSSTSSQSGDQRQQQQQPEPVATANHLTRVSYHNVPLNMADLMMASHSMPAGRRRLDSADSDVRFVSTNQALLDSPDSDPLAVTRETLITAAALNRAANQRRPSTNAAYNKIVDNGAGSQLDERYPSEQLLARLASDNQNRMAMSSARRQQQALLNKMSRRQMGGSPRAQQRPMDVGARQETRGRQMARQESRARRAKSAGRTRDGAAEEGDDEYDELDSRSESSNRDEDSASSDPDDTGDADDDAGDERSPALNRRSSDPFFDEPEEADERRDATAADNNDESPAFNNNADVDGDENESGSASSSGRPRQMLRRQGGQQARSRPETRLRQAAAAAASQQLTGRNVVGGGAGRQMSRRHQQNTSGRRQKPRQAEAGEQDGDEIDSMNSRQQLVRASLRQPLAFNDANSINGLGGAGGRGDKLVDEQDASMNTAAQFNAAAADNLQGADDSDLSASHIRNSATDLQAAAGHHHGHGHYYQFVEVPKKKAWKFGFKRGNHKHTIEKHEKGYKHKFHTKFKWHAKEKCKKKSKCESVGKMTWDYKHHKKHHP